MYNLINIIRHLVIEAATRHPMLNSFTEHEWANINITFKVKVFEAGHYDGSVDGVGMHVGEGWIGFGYSEVELDSFVIQFS